MIYDIITLILLLLLSLYEINFNLVYWPILCTGGHEHQIFCSLGVVWFRFRV
jgi:hypothetical protein